MKRSLFIVILLSLFSKVGAGPVDTNTASAVAAAFLGQSSVKEVPVAFEYLYVFNGENCYVILSADDRALPVVGYSREGCFEAGGMPESVVGWLQSRNQEVQTLVDAGVEASKSVKEAWDSLMNSGALPMVSRDAVAPLIVTTWNQRAPYNGSCPEGCPTGCAATVMAQLMKYWEYPKCGVGEFSYTHSMYGTQYANFGETNYDWDNMPLTANTSSPEQVRKALATLMYHCGVSIEMDYGENVSLAFSSNVPNALITYFGYAPTLSLEFAFNYSEEGWKELLRNELDQARPMYYAGQSAKDGHAFICDGYDEMGLFHFNWGWGGLNDGYYAIGALNPSSSLNYNSYNHAIIGIQPVAYAIEAPENLVADVADGQVNLSWTATDDASSYHVYRNDVLLATFLSEPSFSDIELGYGTYSYYVKAISEAGDRSPRSDVAEAVLLFHVPSPVAAEAAIQEDDLAISWQMPYELQFDLAYGRGTCLGGYGFGEGAARKTYWGQRYPTTMLKNYASMTMQSVSVYFRDEATYTLFIGTGSMTGMSEVITQQNVTINNTGWNDIVLETPLVLDYTNDLWVVVGAPGVLGHPAAYCVYDGSGLNDAARLSTDYSSMTSVADASWLMRINFEDGGYVYRVARNGESQVTGLTDSNYLDSGISSGDYTYQIWSELNGEECEEPYTFSISLARVEVVSTNPEVGTVEGGGLVEVGSWVTVRAVPNMDDVFRYWMIDGVEVSTELEYSFEVTGDVRLEAHYSGLGIDECAILSTVRQIEVFTVNGIKLETFKGDVANWECRLEGFAKGIYLLRITTDEGVVTKKIVVGE